MADKMNKLEAQRQVLPETGSASPVYQKPQGDQDPNSIYLHAEGSPLGDDSNFGSIKEAHFHSLSRTVGSVSLDNDNEDPSDSDVVSKVLSAARIIGLSVPTEGPTSSVGVWAGISQPHPSVVVPAAGDYCQM